ncbi:MAG: alanine racemase [Candidatus Shapirobacteria bacterium]|jgi:alanine racemase|nr:alanine racemase [Candidatus Shapirobacteria bacterium]
MLRYQTLNEITIDSSALINNYNYFQKLNSGCEVCPVLKSNAYGHGLLPVAKFIDSHFKTPYIMVDSLYEAYELSKQKIRTPIMIMGYTDPQNYSVWKKLPYTFTVYDIQSLENLNQYQPGVKIHIKLDTGMCRLGIQKNDIHVFIEVLKKCSHLQVEGIYSHFSQADNPKKITFTNNQIKLFKSMVSSFEKAGFNFKYKHIAATAGAEIIKDPYFNLTRLGLGFYGYSPFGSHTTEGRNQRSILKPALNFTSRLALIKQIHAGNQISYGGTYTARQDEIIGILTAGYFEGIPRDLSNQASFLLKNTKCPVIGNIGMNMTTIKIPRTINIKIGEKVTLISSSISDPNSVYKLSSLLKTIPYTILTGLHSSIKRTII